jgi:hypothetical protein
MRAEKFDQASELLKNLVAGGDPSVAAAARQNLEQLQAMQNWKKENPNGNISFDAQRVDTEADTPASLQVDTVKELPSQPVAFLKGKLIGVNCSAEPQAILEIKSANKTFHLRAKDRAKLPLIGAEQFSCAWKDKAVAVNYREVGEGAGDLISLEFQ